jgi:ribonuclease T2
MLRCLVALCLVIAALAQSPCESIKSESSCVSSSCSWCVSGAVGASCMSNEDAAGLPSSVFTCTKSAAVTLEQTLQHKKSGNGGGNNGDPTMYVLAYSWTPGFCNTESGDPGCGAPESYWTNHFTLHGLWPQYTTTGYPASCTSEAFNPKSPEAVGMASMEQYWPNVQAKEGSSNYDDFWTHEWSKHGTCSGLAQTDYFNTTINLAKSFGTPSIFTQNVGKTVNGDDLRTALGGKTRATLICSNGNQLTGAYTCWSQTNGIPTGQTTCPSSVQSEDTCTSSDVMVVAM